MLSWGEQSACGFRLKDGTFMSHSGTGVTPVDLGQSCGPVTDLCATTRLLGFTRAEGSAFIIRSHRSKDGTWTRGRQKRVEWKEKVQAVSCTEDTLLLLSNHGHVLCVQPHVPPRTLEAFNSVSVAQLSCGSQHCLALTTDGSVFSWGLGSRGQLGLGKRGPGAASPQLVRSLLDLPLVQVAAGGEHSLCLTVSGAVFCWGHNHSGQLGLGDTTDRHTPAQLHHLNMKKVCHISCGDAHTAVLTKDGAVYTFGSGARGQLGHNSFQDELRPRLVAELWGARVTAVACGSFHTVVLTEAQRMYSCGFQNEEGAGQDGSPVPLPVQLPPEHTEGLVVEKIFAGGHCSYAVCASQKTKLSESSSEDMYPPLCDLLNKWTSDTEPWKKTKREIQKMFSSASHLNRSFLEPRKHFQTSSKQCGLDLAAAHKSFSKLLDKPKVLEEVESVSLRLLRSLSPSPVGVECLRVYLLLSELLHVLHQHKNSHLNIGTALMEALAAAILRLPQDSIQVLGDWWSSLPYSTRVGHALMWKDAAVLEPSLNTVRSLLRVLQLFYNRNVKTPGSNRIPQKVFNIPVTIEMVRQFVQWHSDPKFRRQLDEEPVLCSFPFLMDLKTRHQVLRENYSFYIFKNTQRWPNWCFDEEDPDFLDFFTLHFKLRLRRECVMEDTFSLLSIADYRDFKRPLAVLFNGIGQFDNVNQKDFFHLIFHEMVSADSGMFMFNDSATLAWFSSRDAVPLDHFYLFGVLCGLAVFNLHVVFLPFPLALFKKLLGVAPSLDDLCQFSPCTGQGLRCLLEEYSDDEILSLDMDFRIHWDGKEVELDPHNPERAVMAHNKKEFVAAFVQHVFSSSVQREFKEFRRGFFQVADRHTVELFSPEELRTVMVGQHCNDWDSLKQSAVYEGIFHENHPTVQMFWEVFDELTEEQRKALLWFITGFESLPVLNVDHKIQIKHLVKDGELSDDQYYPRSHTCFNGLELPQYSSKDLMRSRLTEALGQMCPSPDQTLATGGDDSDTSEQIPQCQTSPPCEENMSPTPRDSQSYGGLIISVSILVLALIVSVISSCRRGS